MSVDYLHVLDFRLAVGVDKVRSLWLDEVG
jgi:hypothetical protein